MKKRVMVIGLDGGTLDYITPYLKELPTFNLLIKQGTSGPLRSVIPPHTAPAWPSYLTGKYPSNHGIFSFFYKTPDHDIKFVTSKDIAAPTLLDIISFYNKKVISINVPVTYPVWSINGILISGMLTQSKDGLCYPKEILKELPDYKVEAEVNFHLDNIEAFLDNVYDTMEKRKKTVLYLMEKYDWDFFTVVFRPTDTIGHTMRQFLNPSHPMHKKYGKAILECYKKTDKMLKEILTKINKETTLIIMSDHGHGEFKKNINLNIWMWNHGYLKFKGDLSHRFKLLTFKMGLSQDGIYKILSKFKLHNLVARIPRARRYKITNLFLSYKDLNWQKTRAYTIGPQGQIYINLKGRDKDGIVKQGKEYENLRDELIAKLMKLRDPNNGELIFEKIIKKERIYKGPFLDRAPDLYLISKDFSYACYELLTSGPRIFNPAPKIWTGTHKLNGLFLAFGNNIKKNYKIKIAKIIDLAPTILHILGLPVLDNMDGNVLGDIFIKKRKIKIISEKSISYKRKHISKVIEDKTQVEKRLKDLGYI